MLKLIITPPDLLNKISITTCDLAQIKHLPYDKFIHEVISIWDEEGNEEQYLQYFDKKVYNKNEITVEVPDYLDNLNNSDRYTFYRKNGFSNGELLYQIAQKFPNKENIYQYQLKYLTVHTDQILNEIEVRKQQLSIKTKLSVADKHDLKSFNDFYNCEQIVEVIKDSVAFHQYMVDHHNNVVIEYSSDDIYVDKIHWEGLYYYDGVYKVSISS